jgi:hypothetical protein
VTKQSIARTDNEIKAEAKAAKRHVSPFQVEHTNSNACRYGQTTTKMQKKRLKLKPKLMNLGR